MVRMVHELTNDQVSVSGLALEPMGMRQAANQTIGNSLLPIGGLNVMDPSGMSVLHTGTGLMQALGRVELETRLRKHISVRGHA